MTTLYEVEDWIKFTSLETLPQKAGVSRDHLAQAVIKELVDNALDATSPHQQGDNVVEVGLLADDNGFWVSDAGQGLPIKTDEDVARLFSVKRPFVSSKLLRTVTRGLLGNGLRVVAGAVASSDGYFYVETGDKALTLKPDPSDGTTKITQTESIENASGTYIEVHLGPELPVKEDDLWPAKLAIEIARCEGGQDYKGKTSAYWYTEESWYQLVRAAPSDHTVRKFVENIDGCSGQKAGFLTKEYRNRSVNSLSRQEASSLLRKIRENTKAVNVERLGLIGQAGFPESKGYAKAAGESNGIPFVLEAWMDLAPHRTPHQGIGGTILVNKSPILAPVSVWVDGSKDLYLNACNIWVYVKAGSKIHPARLFINIQTPYVPLTSDGKAPDLSGLKGYLEDLLKKCVANAKGAMPRTRKTSLKDLIYDAIEDAMDRRSEGGKYPVTQRGLFYELRPLIMAHNNGKANYGTFTSVITDYESDFGMIEGLERGDRGILYIPHHQGEKYIRLGTRSVKKYSHPELTFHKLLYIEKEGLFNALVEDEWAERHDCALATTSGYATRATRDLIDIIAATDKQVTFYCVHDADAAGSMIYETLQEQTKARGARKVQIVDIGLYPWQAESMGLDYEEPTDWNGRERKVSKAVVEYDWLHGTNWEEQLQKIRYELDAMPVGDFIHWLDQEVGDDKIKPHQEILEQRHLEHHEQKRVQELQNKILQEAGFEEQAELMKEEMETDAATRDQNKTRLPELLDEAYSSDPRLSWRDAIDRLEEYVL